MRVVRLATGVLLFILAVVLLLFGAALAFTAGGTDIAEINTDIHLVGFGLLLLGAAFGWFGWLLVRRRRPLAANE
jgi:hypothetical protein